MVRSVYTQTDIMRSDGMGNRKRDDDEKREKDGERGRDRGYRGGWDLWLLSAFRPPWVGSESTSPDS